MKSGTIGDINIGGGSPTIVRMTTLGTAPQRVVLATNDDTVTFVYARSAKSRRRPGWTDAYVGDSLAASEAHKHGFADLGDVSRYHVKILGSGVNALKSWLARNRPAAAAFIKTTVEAIALVKRDRDAAYGAMQKWYGLTDPDRLAALYAYAIRMPAKPYPSAEGLRLVRSIYRWREMQIHPPSWFIDPSFVAALDRSGYIDGLYKKS